MTNEELQNILLSEQESIVSMLLIKDKIKLIPFVIVTPYDNKNDSVSLKEMEIYSMRYNCLNERLIIQCLLLIMQSIHSLQSMRIFPKLFRQRMKQQMHHIQQELTQVLQKKLKIQKKLNQPVQ